MDLLIEMVNAKWRQRRLCLAESGVYQDQIEEQKEKLDTMFVAPLGPSRQRERKSRIGRSSPRRCRRGYAPRPGQARA